MSYDERNAKIEEINLKMSKYGDGWKAYSNEPDFPDTVVANDVLEIMTQRFDKNWDLKQWMKYSWYHPKYTVGELESLKNRRKTHFGLFPVRDMIPTLAMQHRLYRKFIKARDNTHELLGTKKSSK